MTDSSNDQPASAPNGRRRKLLAAVLGAFAAAGIAYGVYWAEMARYVESTDDAYVTGNVVQITPQIAGTVVAIKADDTQFVRVGDELARLDSSDARIALQRREAQLAQTVREVRGLFTDSARLKAELAARKTDLARPRADLSRRARLVLRLPRARLH